MDEITEADEPLLKLPPELRKQKALTNLRYVVRTHQGQGVTDMYELAALNVGASLDETEAVIKSARKELQ